MNIWRKSVLAKNGEGQAPKWEGTGVLEELQGCRWSWSRFGEGRGGVGKEGREVHIVWDPRKDLVAWWPWMILRMSPSLQFSYL